MLAKAISQRFVPALIRLRSLISSGSAKIKAVKLVTKRTSQRFSHPASSPSWKRKMRMGLNRRKMGAIHR